jgi:CheY-like chemotaxis protein
MDDRRINILLVEDDDLDVMNIQRAMRKCAAVNPMYVASNGVEALRLLRDPEQPVPHERLIVLLDLNMPMMGGIEFLQALRADPALKRLTVIILTTSDEERDKVEAYNLNVAGYLLKPVTVQRFVDTVATLNKYWMSCELP